MILSILKNAIHKILLPRGRRYHEDEILVKNWMKTYILLGQKNICILHQQINNSQHSKGIVFLSHPYLADAKQFFIKHGHAQMYLDLDYGVVILDYNGFGESAFHNFNYAEDLGIVIKHFNTLFPNIPLYAHGISFGASNLINYTTESDHLLDKIIIENCLDSNLTYYKKRNKKLYYLMKGLMKIFPNANKNHNYIKGVSQIINIKKILFIYNTDDTLTTIEMGEKLHKISKIPSELVIFRGKHLEAYETERERYERTVSSFFNKNLT